ncbi:hypothetical protein [Marinobacter sp.]|uniref:hypothetical protein n=1 Tax=Marinobacter sp. TaxID=50741 RepID=UPI0035668944
MAVPQSDIDFINQNFPGSRTIPVDQVRDLASQMSVPLSDELNQIMSQEDALDIDNLESQVGAIPVDIDISDIPLDLNARPNQSPEAPKQSTADPDLAQYDDLMQQAPSEEGLDPSMFGFEPPMAEGPPPMEGPPPEMYEDNPFPEPPEDRKAAFEDDFEASDLSFLNEQAEYGESVSIKNKYKEAAYSSASPSAASSPASQDPEVPMSENSKEVEIENTSAENESTLGGKKSEEQLIVDEIAGDRPVFKMLKDLEEMAQVSENGELDYDVVMRYLKTEVADDEPLLKKLEEEHAKGFSKFTPSVMLKFAQDNPPVNEPTSQPSETQEPTQEAEKKKENDKDNPENKAKEASQQAPVQTTAGAAMIGGTANVFKGAAGFGYGISKALGKGLVGGAKNMKGFYDSHKQNQLKMTSDLKSNVSGLSSQLDAIQADRSAMKSAKGAFEKKQYADRMQKKLQVFEKTAASFADTLGSKQGQKAAKKADMSRSLESLSNKMEKVFNGMEAGKGEKKVMENISASIESALEAVKAVVQAIRNVFSSPSVDGPSNTMQAGPG